MDLKTQIIEFAFRPFHGLTRPKPPLPSGTLSRQELRRLVAEMLD